MTIQKAFLGLVVAAICMTVELNAQELTLPRLFSDGMIVQRDMPVRFWGWAAPGETVKIVIDEFAVNAKADQGGNWECLYPSHVAGGPYEVSIEGSSSIQLKDVYFGDVWIAGGQSNMEWNVKQDIDNMEAEIADSSYPLIRYFDVPNQVSPKPELRIESGEWISASPETVGEFSAVAWFFAKKNHLEKGVPVGIIESNWGGTPAEAWTSAPTLQLVEGYKEEAAEVLNSKINWPRKIAENDSLDKLKWELIMDKKGSESYGVYQSDFDDSSWEQIQLPNEKALTEFAWLRKSFELKSTNDVKLSFGNMPNLTTIYVNGKEIWDRQWQLLEVLELNPDILKKGKNTIALRAVNDWDNRVFIGKTNKLWVQQGKKQTSLEGVWRYSNKVEPKIPESTRYSWKSSFLFNQMIHPIAGYSIKGAIWYQGESNGGQPQYYHELFVHMIRDWREYWRQGDFPFLFVQLANWKERKSEPSESQWAELREAQAQTLELPNTGMAVIIDIGDADDIHPRNKQDVGKRLWLAAQKVAFGEELVYSGPVYSSHKVEGNKVTVQYELQGSELEVRGDNLVGFEVAGEDKVFQWANATVKGDAIVLTSEEVSDPVYVRYAWADNPACNLYNEEGLPAVPFRTD